MLKVISEEVQRLDRIVGDLLEFARPSAAGLVAEPLGPIVSDALDAALRDVGPRIRVVRELDEKLPAVPVDARLLRQALLNLFQNAVQAMPGDGVLAVRARAAGSEVRLEIEDDGEGISPEVMPRIFQPFFSTRATGTGLGLALVKRVMDRHLGRVEVKSEPDRGTSVVLHLPI